MKHDPTIDEARFLRSRYCYIFNAIASVIGGAMAADAAEDAAGAQVEAAGLAVDLGREGLDFQKETFDVSRADLDPYRASGAAALGTLNDLFIPGGQGVVQLQGRLNELRARRAVLARTGAQAPAPAPVQQAAGVNPAPGSPPWWQLVKTSNQWDPGGGGGDGGGGGGGGSGGACFAKGTMIEMAGGREKPIEKIELGDLTAGGKVTATMVFAGSSYAFDYAGTIVEGCHAVYENGAWKRVEDSERARKIGRAVERWYNLNTTNHEIWVAGVRFGDDIEVDHDRPAKTEYWAENIRARNELESPETYHVIQEHMGRFHVG